MTLTSSSWLVRMRPATKQRPTPPFSLWYFPVLTCVNPFLPLLGIASDKMNYCKSVTFMWRQRGLFTLPSDETCKIATDFHTFIEMIASNSTSNIASGFWDNRNYINTHQKIANRATFNNIEVLKFSNINNSRHKRRVLLDSIVSREASRSPRGRYPAHRGPQLGTRSRWRKLQF